MKQNAVYRGRNILAGCNPLGNSYTDLRNVTKNSTPTDRRVAGRIQEGKGNKQNYICIIKDSLTCYK